MVQDPSHQHYIPYIELALIPMLNTPALVACSTWQAGGGGGGGGGGS